MAAESTSQAYHPLFVYGTLMQGESADSHLAEHVVRRRPALLPRADLHALGWYPMAVPGQGQVLGELLWLSEPHYHALLALLDLYEGDEYVRRLTPVASREDRTAAGDHADASIRAWVYWGEPEHARRFPAVPSGDWRAFRTAGIPGVEFGEG